MEIDNNMNTINMERLDIQKDENCNCNICKFTKKYITITQEQLREVEKKFDKLGFFTEITEKADSFIVTIHKDTILNVPKDYIQQSRIIQKGDLFNAFLATVLAKLLWHNEEVSRAIQPASLGN